MLGCNRCHADRPASKLVRYFQCSITGRTDFYRPRRIAGLDFQSEKFISRICGLHPHYSQRTIHRHPLPSRLFSQKLQCNYSSTAPQLSLSFVKDSKILIRYQTTASKDDRKELNKTADDQEERILEKFEEIVDIPSSAFNDLIDRSKYTEQVPVSMPDLGTSHGNSVDRYSVVKEWLFTPGDIIQQGDVLCDIQTPDFTFGMETDDDELAIMGEIVVEAGKPVPDGTVLCILYHESKKNPQVSTETPTPVQENDEDEDTSPTEDGNEDEDDDEDAGKPVDPTMNKT